MKVATTGCGQGQPATGRAAATAAAPSLSLRVHQGADIGLVADPPDASSRRARVLDRENLRTRWATSHRAASWPSRGDVGVLTRRDRLSVGSMLGPRARGLGLAAARHGSRRIEILPTRWPWRPVRVLQRIGTAWLRHPVRSRHARHANVNPWCGPAAADNVSVG